jgi:hypothetical protein
VFERAASSALLFKVAPPRADPVFQPRPFWRTPDWSSSDDDHRDGYIEDHVLYAAGFDEVNIHLLPKVWRLRVWLDDETRGHRLQELGFRWAEGVRAVIFGHASDRDRVESFAPTVFAFERDGFERTPTDEWVSREPRRAIASETFAFAEARERWGFELIYVSDGERLTESLRAASVDHQIQT